MPCRSLRGWFWVDAPASLPLIEVHAFLTTGGASDSSSESGQLLRALRLFRLLRLLRVLKLGELIVKLEEVAPIPRSNSGLPLRANPGLSVPSPGLLRASPDAFSAPMHAHKCPTGRRPRG